MTNREIKIAEAMHNMVTARADYIEHLKNNVNYYKKMIEIVTWEDTTDFKIKLEETIKELAKYGIKA